MKRSSSHIVWIAVVGVAAIAVGWTVRAGVLRSRRLAAAEGAARAAQRQVQDAKQQLAVLLAAARARPRDPAGHRALADLYTAHGLAERAAAELSTVLSLDRTDDATRERLAKAFYDARKYDAAETLYHELTLRRPRALAGWQGLTATLQKEGRFLEAMSVGSQAQRLDPENSTTHLLVAKAALEYAVQFSKPQNHAGELDFARQEFEAFAKAKPDDGQIQFQLARCYVGLRDKPNALSALRRARRILPRDLAIGHLMVIVLRAMNDEPAALKVTQELLSVDPNDALNNDLYGQIVLNTQDSDRVEKAIAAFKIAVNGDPKNTAMLQHLADAQMLAGDMAGARDTLLRAVWADPNLAYTYQRLAMVYTRLGDTKRATATARIGANMVFNDQQQRRIEELSIKHPEDVDLHLILAKRYQTLRKMGPARDEYLTVLRLDPGNKAVPRTLAQAARAYSNARQ